MDKKFVCETPAIERRRGCLKCGKEFNQFIKNQTICHDCLDDEEEWLMEQDEKEGIARGIIEETLAEEIIEGATCLEEAEERLEEL